jgi:hypothetical protein
MDPPDQMIYIDRRLAHSVVLLLLAAFRDESIAVRPRYT